MQPDRVQSMKSLRFIKKNQKRIFWMYHEAWRRSWTSSWIERPRSLWPNRSALASPQQSIVAYLRLAQGCPRGWISPHNLGSQGAPSRRPTSDWRISNWSSPPAPAAPRWQIIQQRLHCRTHPKRRICCQRCTKLSYRNIHLPKWRARLG